MHKTVVINAVGLTPALIGEATPTIRKLVERGRLATIREVIPAVTCTAQTTYLTGKAPREHGIVGNGWFFKDTCEIRFWHQSNKLVQSPYLWDEARRIDPTFTVANICWWYAMYSGCDYTVTPRPIYPADGRKLPDCWTRPPTLRDELQRKLGQFPLFKFWGPMTSIEATRWIASAAIEVDQRYDPTLSLIYLPHMDYNLQRKLDSRGDIDADLFALDQEIARLVHHFDSKHARVVLLSEYGISPVTRPIHLNRLLRQHGLITLREERGRELLDAGASKAFAVADHQIAHVYVNEPTVLDKAASIIRETPGVAKVYVGSERNAIGLDHDRAGDIVALAEADSWFTYYYWLDDARAPDFARTVDIHRKPGYDPAELFIDPSVRFPKLKIASKLLARKLGFRNLLDVIPLDATLVKGSHGVPAASRDHRPVVVGDASLMDGDEIDATDVYRLLARHLTH
jgi:predicted AlkP superfamily pyrophosphatase or phosphodiesterase